jgi:hypothetical protein
MFTARVEGAKVGGVQGGQIMVYHRRYKAGVRSKGTITDSFRHVQNQAVGIAVGTTIAHIDSCMW